jgi:thiol-disulfide isomerase/thioredoxin
MRSTHPKHLICTLVLLAIFQFASRAFGQLAPSNDNFANALPLVGTNVTALGSNVYATKEIGEPNHADNPGGKSVWWYWQAPENGYVTISTAGSTDSFGNNLDTELGVYTGSSVATLSAVASNDDGPIDYTSLVSFKAVGGTIYRIAVDGYSYSTPANAETGNIVLSLTFSTTLPKASHWNLPSIDGTRLDSTNFSGQVVVLNFWATWCGPCIAEMPDLIALQQKYAPDGLTVIGVSVDDSPNGSSPPTSLVSSFAASYGMNYPIVMTRPSGYSVEYAYGGIDYIPNTFIIDRHNQITQTFVGTQIFNTFESAILPLLYENLAINMQVINGQAHISWPIAQAGFVVESSSDPAGGVWTPMAAPIQSDGINQYMDVPLETTARFFRLRH